MKFFKGQGILSLTGFHILMPELPDVEQFRTYTESTSLHQKIKSVEVRSEDVLEEISASELRNFLEDEEFESTDRHGKYLFVKLSNSWLVMHFGMSGFLEYFKDPDDEPPHTRILIKFTNNFNLAYDCTRKLGRISTAESVQEYIKRKSLGPDALNIDYSQFKKILEGRRGMIKPALMNQHIIAGIGNIYSDETLFQSGIHPKTKVKKLDNEHLKNIHKKMQEILETAIKKQANTTQFPSTYIIPHREKGGKCPKCGTKLNKIKVSGRTAYYCPEHQTTST